MSKSERSFESERHQETLTELQTVREKLRSVSSKLGEAEAVIRFYADPRNFEASRKIDGNVYQDRVKNDHYPSDNDNKTKLAGFRAKDYLRRYENG